MYKKRVLLKYKVRLAVQHLTRFTLLCANVTRHVQKLRSVLLHVHSH